MIRHTYLILMFWAASAIGVNAGGNLSNRSFLPPASESSDILFDEEDSTDQFPSPIALESEISDSTQESTWKDTGNSRPMIPREKKIRKPWPTGALMLSAAIPGGGQFYNRKYIKTILYGGTEAYLLWYVRWRWKQMDEHWRNVVNAENDTIKTRQFSLYEQRRDSRNVHLWLTALVVFVSMFDAYVDAHLADFDQTDKAFEVYVAPEADRIQLGLVYNFR
ncbi:MAG: hypothetical protein GY839_01625 [candidate division Zixibacteria bacterium]|nr:hypothetical protein [candidate division Zixibacteria bacterium]